MLKLSHVAMEHVALTDMSDKAGAVYTSHVREPLRSYQSRPRSVYQSRPRTVTFPPQKTNRRKKAALKLSRVAMEHVEHTDMSDKAGAAFHHLSRLYQIALSLAQLSDASATDRQAPSFYLFDRSRRGASWLFGLCWLDMTPCSGALACSEVHRMG